MKKSVATYIKSFVVGSVLGFGSLAAATTYPILPTTAKCTTSGGSPTWNSTPWSTNAVYNMSRTGDTWVTCTDITSVSAASVDTLLVKVVQRGIPAGVAHTKVITQWANGSTTYQNRTKQLTTSSLNPQTMTLSGPWLTNPWGSSAKPQVKVFLPRVSDTVYSVGNELSQFTAIDY